jgi:hypothetical protein
LGLALPQTKDQLRDRLRDHLVTGLKNKLQQYTLAQRVHFIYNSVKGDFGFSLSLSSSLPFRRLLALARFRLGQHRLNINNHSIANRDMRLCSICDLQQVDDEYHFLLYCPALSSIRPPTWSTLPLPTTPLILARDDPLAFSTFLLHSFSVRSSHLEDGRDPSPCPLAPAQASQANL